MYKALSILPVLLCGLLLALPYGCSDDPNDPVQPPVPDDTTSHEFVWEIDTLFYEGTTTPVHFRAKTFYGTDDNNVILCGYSNAGYECWKWDGSNWTFFDLGRYSLGDIADIDGVDSSYIVLLGWSPAHETIEDLTSITTIMQGTISYLPKPLGTRNRTCLHVVSRNEIYLGGIDGIQKYDGTKWEWMLDSTNSIEDSHGHEFYPEYIHVFADGTMEFVSQRGMSPEEAKYFLWRKEQSRFVVVDTFSLDQQDMNKIRFGYSLNESGGDVLAASKGGIYMYRNATWNKLHDVSAIHIAGTENNLYCASNWGAFQHYNGSTWADLYSTIVHLAPDIQFINKIYFQPGTIFLAIQTSTYSAVIRGLQQ